MPDGCRPNPGMWITRFPSVESIEDALISVGLPASIATNGEGSEVFDVTRGQLATLRLPVHEVGQ
jgi:hypothetical protein